jgi:hypothetical protein
MANEITVTASLRYTASVAPLFKILKSLSISVSPTAGAEYLSGSQEIGTGEENLAKGEIGTIGWLIARNLSTHASAFVEFGHYTGRLSAKCLAGEILVARYDAAQIIAKATTAACVIEYLIVEL